MFKAPLPGPLLPPWRLILLSDGSVTRHLQLLSGRPIEVVRPSTLTSSLVALQGH